MKNTIEELVNVHTFNINKLMMALDVNAASNEAKFSDLTSIQQALQEKINDDIVYTKINKNLIRFAFLIELVKDDVTSTKFEVRWTPRLIGDPRYSNYDTCEELYFQLLNNILNFEEEYTDLLKLVTKNYLISYDIPIDYQNIIMQTDSTFHNKNNVSWIDKELFEDVILTRTILLDREYNEEKDVFERAIKDKIKVKTYLTDRALTGIYKTNREKRWETHPGSVQFAFRRDAYQIEKKLSLQICKFSNISKDLVTKLVESNLMEEEYEVFKCPIIGREINFNDFKDSILNSTHGKSKYQVGHMNPLKSVRDGVFGHTPSNISWVTEDGNRIQGPLELGEVYNLFFEVFENKPWELDRE